MAQHRPVTLRDIADRVGVGPATVSVVLNGSRSGTKVSETTRAAVLKAASELNYRPNALARSLRTRRTGIIGFFSGYQYVDPRNEYIASVISGMQAGCQANDLDLLLYTPQVSHTAEDIVRNLADGRFDGLVVTARPEHPIAHLLASAQLPVVAIADPLPDLPCVLADAAEGGRLQARYLARKGHKKVLYVPSDYPFLSVLDRYEGFFEEATCLGMEVVMATPVSGHGPVADWEVERSVKLSEADMSCLQSEHPCTAIQCWDDAPAYRIASQLAEAGISVPQQVAVMGYNGCTTSVEPRWKLTTICANWPQVGETAVQVLAAMIQGRNYATETVLPVHLVEGNTA